MIKNRNLLSLGMATGTFASAPFTAAGAATPRQPHVILIMTDQHRADAPWRKYIDSEQTTCYWADYGWVMLTDGKIKYIWFQQTGDEQLFDLTADPGETRNLTADKRYKSKLEEMRSAMAEHLAERGPEWSVDGYTVVNPKRVLYSPNFPKATDKK